ncbi:hypothetical protein C446_13469 [Halobiforma nitratireducens JCM 10879]|uniref:Uncharacterized protein n=1 Tax=Halobiforma nitratireducens JCM 10879 TaxID=1227454 RepID=M0LMM1_9EURY|nr:hypothetical protein C446_13469 [Halobiforma nitratireducens JCM 10879]
MKRSALTALALGIGGSASGAASRSTPEIEQFRVKGTRETTVRYEPETITVTVRKRSPALSDRLESQRDEFVDEIEYDRTALNDTLLHAFEIRAKNQMMLQVSLNRVGY